MPLTFVREDITRLHVDAIVNAANSGLRPGGGVCGAIFSAAGHDQMEAACRKIGHCSVGSAVITPGFSLSARYVIHAVGPIWNGGSYGEAKLLASCYTSALRLAKAYGLSSIAFPLISSGIYGYPKAEALDIAITAIRRFLDEEEDLHVALVLFDRAALTLGRERSRAIAEYIDDHYVREHSAPRCRQESSIRIQYEEQMADAMSDAFYGDMDGGVYDAAYDAMDMDVGMTAPYFADAAPAPRKLSDVVRHLDETFSSMLLRLIDERGLKDTEVYKRANIDRRLFSKIRKSSYVPSKATALALCIALRLSLDETHDLLSRAGLALSPSSLSDVIIRFHIERGIYNIDEVNAALFEYGQMTLGV